VVAFRPDGEIDDTVSELEGKGVEFAAGGISEHPWGRVATFKDPDGNDLQLYAPPK
jgi:predicted enzyme related to lactoylglutathione lyase